MNPRALTTGFALPACFGLRVGFYEAEFPDVIVRGGLTRARIVAKSFLAAGAAALLHLMLRVLRSQ